MSTTRSFDPDSELFFDGESKKKVIRESDAEESEGGSSSSTRSGKSIFALMVFKTGVKPAWEDPENKMGGEWTAQNCTNVMDLDRAFENVLLAMVGETLDDEADVNGLRVVDKSAAHKGSAGCRYRLELWLRTSDKSVTEQIIKPRLENALAGADLQRKLAFSWKPHGSHGRYPTRR